jgi:ketosteroid isomerase-like protein
MTNTELMHRYIAAFNDGDLDAFDALIAPDYVNHSPATPDPEPGPAGLKPIVAMLLEQDPGPALRGPADRRRRRVRRHLHEGPPVRGGPDADRKGARRQIVEHWRVTQAA